LLPLKPAKTFIWSQKTFSYIWHNTVKLGWSFSSKPQRQGIKHIKAPEVLSDWRDESAIVEKT
jgi:hypothetical protein